MSESVSKIIRLTAPLENDGIILWRYKAPLDIAAHVAFDLATGRKTVEALIESLNEHENVSLLECASFNKDELRHGIWQHWNENGQLTNQVAYDNGHIHGLAEGWYDNGQKRFETPLDQGKIHGLQRCWHENGQQSYGVVFRDNAKHGSSTIWDRSGDVIESGMYEHDHKMGAWYEKPDNGTDPAYSWHEFHRYVDDYTPVQAHSEAELHEKVVNFYTDKLAKNQIFDLEIYPS